VEEKKGRQMKGIVALLIGASLTGCASFQQVTYEERIQIRQNMARLQTEQVQRQIIKYTNDKRH
jgi:hypothetical protein